MSILNADTIKQVEMKEKIKKEYLRRTRKLLETNLSSRFLIKGINTLPVPIIRYSGPFFKGTREELKQMDLRTKQLMTMHETLYPRYYVEIIYVSKKAGGRGLTSIEDSLILRVKTIQTNSLLRPARILRRVLEGLRELLSLSIQ